MKSLLGILLLSWFVLSTSYSQNLSNNKKEIIDRINKEDSIGHEYFTGGKWNEKDALKKAIEHYEKAVKYMKSLSSDEILKNNLYGVYYNIGSAYFSQGNNEKSLEYKKKFFIYFPDGLNLREEENIILQNLYINNAQNGWERIRDIGIINEALSTKDGSYYFYNPKTIKKINGIIKVWLKCDKTGIKPPNENEYGKYATEKSTKSFNELLQVKFPYYVSLQEFDCNNQKTRMVSVVSYDKDGVKENYWEDNNTEWTNIVPGTIIEYISEYFCKQLK